MWIEKRGDKFRFIERYVDPMTGKEHRTSVMFERNTAQTRKNASQILNMKIMQLMKEPDLAKRQPTLGEIAERYLADRKLSVAPSSYTTYCRITHVLLLHLGEDTLACRLNANYIRERLLDTGRDPVTLNNWIRQLKIILHWAYRNDYIEDISFVDKLELFKDRPHREKIENKYLEKEELAALISSIKDDKYRIMTEFLALTGLRFGEAAALRVDDIGENEIHILRNYSPLTHEFQFPKTSDSIRDIAIQPELREVIRKAQIYFKRQQVIFGYRTDLLFSSIHGTPVSYSSYNFYLKEAAKRVTQKNVTAHMLRHTHASPLMEAGVPIEMISRRLGHGDSRITKEIYLHVTKKMKKRDAERIAQVRLLS